ncbi:MAG TPA: VOC family protein [Candidatus Limnocylindrales bacterium]|nr:VOC family protein [Candidatus Limnocylindrales bacterium]
MLAIDHVILPVLDLADAAAGLDERYGLASVEGGRHPAWGTANRIIPLGDTYLELVAVVDHETARGSAFGRWIASAIPGRPLGWAVRTDSIDAVGRRLGHPVVPGSRVAPGGAQVTWRSVGLDSAVREPGLPFFIQWGDDVPFPAAAAVRHRGGPATLKRLSVAADEERLADWLGDHDLAIAAVGPSGTSSITLTREEGDFTLE